MAIIRMPAPASYSRTEASIPFPCSIISLEIAVIAIKSGSVIGDSIDRVKYTDHS